MDRLLEAWRVFGLTISLDKTVVMFQPAPGTVYVEPSIYTDGKKLKVVDKITYLGSTIKRFCSLDDEIAFRLKKSNGRFLWPERSCVVPEGTEKEHQARSVQCLCVDMSPVLMWNMGDVPEISETSRAFSSALPRIYSRYPLDNHDSRHRSFGESEYDQHRNTHPPTLSSLGGSRYMACWRPHSQAAAVWRTICWLPPAA